MCVYLMHSAMAELHYQPRLVDTCAENVLNNLRPTAIYQNKHASIKKISNSIGNFFSYYETIPTRKLQKD